MPQTELSRFFLLFLVAAAFFGLALVPLLLLQSNLQADQSQLRRPLVGVIYSVICIGGIVAVFYPGKCRLTLQKPKGLSDSTKSSVSKVNFKGHHPDCANFSANRITIMGSVFCAACSGLLIGAIAAMVGVVLFSLGFSLGTGSLWALVAGEVLMIVGLAQIKTRGYVKMGANALFVVGSFISLVEADLAAQSFLVDAYVLGLIVFMLWFRILLSEWNNKRTCDACGRCI